MKNPGCPSKSPVSRLIKALGKKWPFKKKSRRPKVEKSIHDLFSTAFGEGLFTTSVEPSGKPECQSPSVAVENHPAGKILSRLNELATDCDASALSEYFAGIHALISGAEERPDMRSVEEIVDRLDDLTLITPRQSPKDASRVSTCIDLIRDYLEEQDIRIVRENSWRPDIQRAISKTATEGITTPRISGYGSSGIEQAGEIIRKQEVLLEIPIE